jgi:hypothetical protein
MQDNNEAFYMHKIFLCYKVFWKFIIHVQSSGWYSDLVSSALPEH